MKHLVTDRIRTCDPVRFSPCCWKFYCRGFWGDGGSASPWSGSRSAAAAGLIPAVSPHWSGMGSARCGRHGNTVHHVSSVTTDLISLSCQDHQNQQNLAACLRLTFCSASLTDGVTMATNSPIAALPVFASLAPPQILHWESVRVRKQEEAWTCTFKIRVFLSELRLAVMLCHVKENIQKHWILLSTQ